MPINVALRKGDATKSANYPNPGAAFDGDIKTSSGENANKDGILAVDLGSEKTLYRSVIHFVTNTPQRYKIQVSNDAVAWTDILRAFNPNLEDDRVLPAVGARYLRFLLGTNSATGENSSVLTAVSEIEIYERDAADRPTGCAPILYPTPIDRKLWKASSNAGFTPQNAIASASQGFIDTQNIHSTGTPWLVRAGSTVGSYIAIDMGSAQTFNQIDAVADHDALQEYKIFVSDDGMNWGTPISEGTIVPTGGYFYAPFTFPAQTKRHFKIVSNFNTGGRYWGFGNVSALSTEGSSQRDLGDNVNIALNKTTEGSSSKTAATVFDGNDSTGINDAGLVAVDLGASYPIARINVKFGINRRRVHLSGSGVK